jgi:hypothetical protein
VRGVTRGASYFPDIVEAKLEILHQGETSRTAACHGQGIISPAASTPIGSRWKLWSSEWHPGGLGFTLVVEIDGLTFLAELPKVVDAAVQAETLMQKRVLLRGIVGSITSRERQLTDRYFFVPSFEQLIPIEGNPAAGQDIIAHDHSSATE